MAPTPKFKSAEFKDALQHLKEVFDAHSLGIVLLDALERKSAEAIFGQLTGAGSRGRISSVEKLVLVGQITGHFFTSGDIAYLVIKDMDRACQKERHIVASIPEAQASERIGSYRAISLKRERAKLVWALARDDRASVRVLAGRIINEFFNEVADMEKARAITRGDDVASDQDTELALRLQEHATRLGEATEKVSDLEEKVKKYEDDRAALLAQMGQRERQLKLQLEKRGEVEEQLASFRSRFESLERDHEDSLRAKEQERAAKAIADELAQKVRRLEKLASASGSLATLHSELDEARQKITEMSRQAERQEQAFAKERSELERERERLRSELESVREDLRLARKTVDRPERKVPRVGEERLAVLLDQANLAAVATQSFGQKVNFAGLLEAIRSGRKLVRAVAFVVDNGGGAFDAFCDTLRRSGWDVRIKKPKRFSDGTSKADWDMGIAMEAVDLHDRIDTLCLVSGDGDFAPLVRRMQRFGQRVEVASFPEGLAQDLVSSADHVIRLDRSALEL